MRISRSLAVAAGLVALAACNKKSPEQNQASQIEANAQNEAENVTAAGSNEAANILNSAENRAGAVKNEASNEAAAIKNSAENKADALRNTAGTGVGMVAGAAFAVWTVARFAAEGGGTGTLLAAFWAFRL